MGTGPYAILSISLAKRLRCRILACDINPEYVTGSRRTAELNAATVRIINSDLFSSIEDKFDVIFFNSIYIPRQKGRRWGIDLLHDQESDWCGGESGTETIDRFLRDAYLYLKDNGQILLGFNPRYLPASLVVRLCNDYGYEVKATCRAALNPSQVLVMRRRD